MITPLSHVGQTAHPEAGAQQQQQGSPDGSAPDAAPGGGTAGRPQRGESPPPGDPASDANTEPANHPNDE